MQNFLGFILNENHDEKSDLNPVAICVFYYVLIFGFDHACDCSRNYNPDLGFDFPLTLALVSRLDSDRCQNLALSDDLVTLLKDSIGSSLKLALSCRPSLACVLEELNLKLQDFDNNSWPDFHKWWKANGSNWMSKLNQEFFDYSNNQNWQFTTSQKEILKTYYALNRFLVQLLNIEAAVTSTVREEIEDNLLLPMTELQRRGVA